MLEQTAPPKKTMAVIIGLEGRERGGVGKRRREEGEEGEGGVLSLDLPVACTVFTVLNSLYLGTLSSAHIGVIGGVD